LEQGLGQIGRGRRSSALSVDDPDRTGELAAATPGGLLEDGGHEVAPRPEEPARAHDQRPGIRLEHTDLAGALAGAVDGARAGRIVLAVGPGPIAGKDVV